MQTYVTLEDAYIDWEIYRYTSWCLDLDNSVMTFIEYCNVLKINGYIIA